MKEALKELAECIGSFLLQNILGGVAGTAGIIGILHCARLWLRSAFSELYEYTFVFIIAAFLFGVFLGAFRRFEEYYKSYTSKYKARKERERCDISRFMRLKYHEKKIIYEAYVKGSFQCDVSDIQLDLNELLIDFDTPSEFWSHYLNIEIINESAVKLTLNDFSCKLLKRHPELLDCLKNS